MAYPSVSYSWVKCAETTFHSPATTLHDKWQRLQPQAPRSSEWRYTSTGSVISMIPIHCLFERPERCILVAAQCDSRGEVWTRVGPPLHEVEFCQRYGHQLCPARRRLWKLVNKLLNNLKCRQIRKRHHLFPAQTFSETSLGCPWGSARGYQNRQQHGGGFACTLHYLKWVFWKHLRWGISDAVSEYVVILDWQWLV